MENKKNVFKMNKKKFKARNTKGQKSKSLKKLSKTHFKRVKIENINEINYKISKRNLVIFILLIIFLVLIITIILNIIKIKINNKKCYLPPQNPNIKFIHLIITRFMVELPDRKYFKKVMFTDDYIKNAIRVMKKYLIYSLENQMCKDFIWILKVGNEANLEYIKSLLNFKKSFKSEQIYEKDLKNYVADISKGKDILITTRIDYDDCIYYNAVNDVRKVIDINKPIFLHGYNKGVYYYESENKYYEYFNLNKLGFMSIFISLIVNQKEVNDTIIVYDLLLHTYIIDTLLKNYKAYGIKEINYNPAEIDISDQKFIWVRQNYSGTMSDSIGYEHKLKPCEFNLKKFFGK